MKTAWQMTDTNRQQILKEANAMMIRIILFAGLMLSALSAATAAPMAVPSVSSTETIVYQQPEVEKPTYPVQPPQTPVTDCSQYPGTVAFGLDCVPVTGGGPTTTTINQPPGGCYEGQYMRNGICVNRPTYGVGNVPTQTTLSFPGEVQAELIRVGCLRKGGNDGDWGPESRTALAKFYTHSRMRSNGSEPTEIVLGDVSSQRGQICPAIYVAPSGPNCSRIKYAYKSGNTCKCEGSRKFNGKYCIETTTTTVSTGGGKPKCSKIKYAYTSGNTCKCSGGRSFNGNYCVKNQTTTTTPTKVHSDQASGQTVVDIINLFTDKKKNKKPEYEGGGGGYTPKCYKSCDDEGRNCETVCE